MAMSGVDFTRLGCGRATGEQVQAAGGMEVEGDAALGYQVLGRHELHVLSVSGRTVQGSGGRPVECATCDACHD